MRNWAILSAALAGAALLAGCTPQARIQSSCERNGNTPAACRCFADELARRLTQPQLEAFARLQSQPPGEVSREDNSAVQEAMGRTLGLDGAMTVAGAAKRCEVQHAASSRP